MNIIGNIDADRYDTIMVGITKDGRWLLTESMEQIADGSWRNGRKQAVLLPDAKDHGILILDGEKTEKVRIDVVFPALHGFFGEDGTVQGIFELARIPYVGCGVLASAVSMDKMYTKIVVGNLGRVRQADYVPVFREELTGMDEVITRVEAKFAYPVFIKPANEGSSCGVTKAENRERLAEGLRLAAEHDRKILVEETIVGREIECAVFGGGAEPVIAFGIGEILAAADYYDYDAKYNNPESQTIVGPTLPGDAAEVLMRNAVDIFKAVDGYGLARVDFFVTEDGTVVFNELNTLPGFTAISMYPMIAEGAGFDKKALMTKLIEHGLKRYR